MKHAHCLDWRQLWGEIGSNGDGIPDDKWLLERDISLSYCGEWITYEISKETWNKQKELNARN